MPSVKVHMPPSMYEDLRLLGFRAHKPMSAVVRDALEIHIHFLKRAIEVEEGGR